MLGLSLDFGIAFKVECLDKLRGRYWSASANYSGIFKFLTVFEKKSVQGICYLHLIKHNFFIFEQVYFSLDLFFSERNYFTVNRTFCYQWYSFHLNFQSTAFFLFWEEICKILLVSEKLIFFHLSDFFK